MYAVPKNTFDLTVVRVGSGGNTDDGKYFYSFSPTIVLLRKEGPIKFELKNTSPGIRIAHVVASAGSEQIGKICVPDDGQWATVEDRMSGPALINLAVLVTDDESDEVKYIVCDPQVINVPE